MNDSMNDRPRRNPLRIAIWSIAAIALLTPWVAMQFTAEVAWDSTDFVVFGVMLLVVCGGYELAVRLSGNRAYRLASGIALLGAFLMTWANLAVGIIGNEENPVNLVFFAIPLVGLAGAVIARFRPRGMSLALIATAIAQAAVAVVALLAGWGFIFVFTGFFVLLWLTSAYLFSISARE